VEIDLTGPGRLPLPYAFIYGENGSGKSTLIESFEFLANSTKTIITMNLRRRSKDERGPPSSGGMSTDKPAGSDMPKSDIVLRRREIELEQAWVIANIYIRDIITLAERARTIGSDSGVSVSYLFTIGGRDGYYEMRFGKDSRLIYEKLSFIVEQRTSDIFEICASEKNDAEPDDHHMKVKFSPQLFRNKEYRRAVDDIVMKYWGKHSFMSILNDQCLSNNTLYMKESLGTEILEVVRFFRDIWVYDYCGASVRTDTYDKIMANLAHSVIPLNEESQLLIYERALNSFFTAVCSDVKKAYYERVYYNNEVIEYTLFFSKMISGKRREISVRIESTGMIKLLNLFPVFLECARGKTVFVDDLDTGIHDLLIKGLISELKDSFKGQFVATTHNTSLFEISDPQNTFVIRIDPDGEKTITPISRIERTQKNHNNRNRYLKGVFGAVPVMGAICFDDIVQRMDSELKDTE
jgi:AAA15 family ATPase/GTPase